GTITSILSDYKVAPGDVFFLPAGRIHAIGGGCYLAEVQQTSNITYRIYDYNRPGLDGKPRQLHTEEAKEAIDYTVLPDYRTHYVARPSERVELVKCPFFTTSLYDLMSGSAAVLEDISALDVFLAFICMEGAGTVNGVAVSAGEVVLLSPEEKVLELSGRMKALTTHE
ncbi:MAG: mannose-6-phosphate isomerase, partial [Bacteroidales bacterium]|nr:mannose-6-phosphate isomerase [Bacteroidales bacterium]